MGNVLPITRSTYFVKTPYLKRAVCLQPILLQLLLQMQATFKFHSTATFRPACRTEGMHLSY